MKTRYPTYLRSRVSEALASGLQQKLEPILFQFPHTWSVNSDRLKSFLDLLTDYPQK
ncbi:MAG TPA: hypothetical protein V6D30_17405 [Leptolyngbyaceae cyanobacterium]